MMDSPIATMARTRMAALMGLWYVVTIGDLATIGQLLKSFGILIGGDFF